MQHRGHVLRGGEVEYPRHVHLRRRHTQLQLALVPQLHRRDSRPERPVQRPRQRGAVRGRRSRSQRCVHCHDEPLRGHLQRSRCALPVHPIGCVPAPIDLRQRHPALQRREHGSGGRTGSEEQRRTRHHVPALHHAEHRQGRPARQDQRSCDCLAHQRHHRRRGPVRPVPRTASDRPAQHVPGPVFLHDGQDQRRAGLLLLLPRTAHRVHVRRRCNHPRGIHRNVAGQPDGHRQHHRRHRQRGTRRPERSGHRRPSHRSGARSVRGCCNLAGDRLCLPASVCNPMLADFHRPLPQGAGAQTLAHFGNRYPPVPPGRHGWRVDRQHRPQGRREADAHHHRVCRPRTVAQPERRAGRDGQTRRTRHA